MPQGDQRDSLSFVLRLRKHIDPSQRSWRGQLECVVSGEKTYFNDSIGLLEAIEHWIPNFTPDDPKEEHHAG